MSRIHATALVHTTARVAASATIGPFSIIAEEAEVGEDCAIADSVLIDRWAKLGKRVQVFHGAAVGGQPQDLKFKGEKSFVEIGDGTVIREFVTANRGTGEGGVTKVGSGVLLMAYSHVAHDCEVGDGVILANGVNLAGHVTIEPYAIVGGITPVHQFVRIGKHAIVGGASRAAQDVVPFAKASGNPLRIYGLNTVGLTRQGIPFETQEILKRAFRLLFRSGLNTTQALGRLKNDLPQLPEIQYLIRFVEATKRGITK